MTVFRASRLLPALALAFLVAARGPSAPQPNPAASWLIRLGVDDWHAAGFKGQGVKVAILDSGFRGWQNWLGSALPNRVDVRSFRFDRQLESRDSFHGVLCAEVVYAIAPEAELLFANWQPDQPESFVQAVAWAKKQGARVLTCSVIMPSWSDGEGGGPVHAALRSVVGSGSNAGDMLCCACAGNTAQRHWSGPYRPDAAGWHEWKPGERDNPVTPWADEERVSIEMCWSKGSAYRLVVLDAQNCAIIGQSTATPNADAHCAVVRFVPRPQAQYAIRVQPLTGQYGSFHVQVLGGWLATHTERGSIPFPADGPEFLAIGAWEETGRRASYSSCGPNSPTLKPDFVGVVPVPSSVRSKPFSGTSAASPQAAGLAALWFSRHPNWTANQVRAALRSSAMDVADPGHDVETGYGVLRLVSP